jgi:hypothetical protein
MECQQCGVPADEDDRYCSACGAELTAHSVTEDSTATGIEDDVSEGYADNSGLINIFYHFFGSSVSGWSTSRKVTFVGGLLAAVSLVLPFVRSVDGEIAAFGIQLMPEGGPIPFAVYALLPVVATYRAWGRGWGWVSMLVTVVVSFVLYIFGVSPFVADTDILRGFHLVSGGTVQVISPSYGVGLYLLGPASILLMLGSAAGILGAMSARLRLWFHWLIE